MARYAIPLHSYNDIIDGLNKVQGTTDMIEHWIEEDITPSKAQLERLYTKLSNSWRQIYRAYDSARLLKTKAK